MSRIGRFATKVNPYRIIKHIAEGKAKRYLEKGKFEIVAMKVEDGEEQESNLTVVGFYTALDIIHKLFNEDWDVTMKAGKRVVYTLKQPV